MKHFISGNLNRYFFVPLNYFRHARKYLSSTDPTQVADVQKLMGMLAFDCNKPENPYSVRPNLFLFIAFKDI